MINDTFFLPGFRHVCKTNIALCGVVLCCYYVACCLRYDGWLSLRHSHLEDDEIVPPTLKPHYTNFNCNLNYVFGNQAIYPSLI